jgi:hypothetical protein
MIVRLMSIYRNRKLRKGKKLFVTRAVNPPQRRTTSTLRPASLERSNSESGKFTVTGTIHYKKLLGIDDTKPFPFLELPAEIRIAIYEYAAVRSDKARLHHQGKLDTILLSNAWLRFDNFALTQGNLQHMNFDFVFLTTVISLPSNS